MLFVCATNGTVCMHACTVCPACTDLPPNIHKKKYIYNIIQVHVHLHSLCICQCWLVTQGRWPPLPEISDRDCSSDGDRGGKRGFSPFDISACSLCRISRFFTAEEIASSPEITLSPMFPFAALLGLGDGDVDSEACTLFVELHVRDVSVSPHANDGRVSVSAPDSRCLGYSRVPLHLHAARDNQSGTTSQWPAGGSDGSDAVKADAWREVLQSPSQSMSFAAPFLRLGGCEEKSSERDVSCAVHAFVEVAAGEKDLSALLESRPAHSCSVSLPSGVEALEVTADRSVGSALATVHAFNFRSDSDGESEQRTMGVRLHVWSPSCLALRLNDNSEFKFVRFCCLCCISFCGCAVVLSCVLYNKLDAN